MSESLSTGCKVKLAPMSEDDRELFIRLSMDEKVMQFIGEPRSYEESVKQFEELPTEWSDDTEKWFMLSVKDIQTGEIYGDTALKMIDPDAKKAEVGFMIKPEAQGKGIGTETLALIIQYAFESLGLNKLVAYVEVDNIGSWKALEKAGFIREGCLKQNAFILGKYVDDYVYGLCRSDMSYTI